MSEREPSILVQDMVEAVSRILSYCEGYDYEHFVEDGRTMDAVLRNLQILGEAASRISPKIRDLAPDIEWSRIVRSRHIIVHD